MSESAESTSPHCPTCGATLSEAAGGMCPRCLMAGAMAPTGAPGTGVGREAPPLAEVVAAFPQFEIIEMIGAGGMGTVWRARQPKLHREVALKLLPASLAERDPAFAERFEREGQLLARLHHPNIVTVHDSGRTGAFFHLVMELVDGVNLRQAMRASRFTPAQALAIVPKICEALQYAHEEGVLHRDIKPENILLDAKGRVKLVDFGIAKLVAQPEPAPAGGASPAPAAGGSLTQDDGTLGTPNYMAPEQIDRPAEVDHRADIYSLGVVFYELLTGELPVGKFAPPSHVSAADPRLDGIVQQALEKERGRRQQSVDEMRTQVETVAGAPAPPPDLAVAPSRFSFPVIAGMLGGILAMDVAIWLFVGNMWKLNPLDVGRQPGRWLADHEFVVPLFALLLVGLVDWFFIRSVWRTEKPGTGALPPPLRREETRPAVWPTALLHVVVMAIVCAAVAFGAARSVMIFRDLQLPVSALTQFVCDVGHARGRESLLLLPFLVAVDVGLCFLARAVGGRLGLRSWTAAVVTGWMLLGVGAGFALRLPLEHSNRPGGRVASGPVYFSPVFERVLPFDGGAIDFQTGTVLQPDWQKILTLPENGYANWIREHGVDALVDEAGGSPKVHPAPDGLGPRLIVPMRDQAGEPERCVFVNEELAAFDALRPEDAAARLKVVTEKKISWTIVYGLAPWWFQTLDGAKGVVQITGTSDQPRGLKIRYKLVVADYMSAVSPPGPFRIALLPQRQIAKSAAALQELKARAAVQDAAVKAGTASGREWQARQAKVAALEVELQRSTAEWSKFEQVLARHKASGVSHGEFVRAQNAVGTAEVRLRMAQAVVEDQAAGLVFGPEQERFIPANDEAPWPWFDIDAGRLHSFFGEEEQVEDFHASMTAGHRSLSTAEETGFGVVALAAAQWENLTPGTLAERLKAATADSASAEDPLPRTYGFTTRAGGMGVLQIVAVGANPRGLKIRYKLLQTTVNPPGVASIVTPAELQAARAILSQLEARFQAGIVGGREVAAARSKVEVLEAELRDDKVEAVRARLRGARAELEIVTRQNAAGAVTALELEKAKGEVAIAEAKLRLAEAAAAPPNPAFGPVMERVLLSGEPCREHYLQFRNGESFIVGNGPGTSSAEAAEDEKRIAAAGGVDLSATSDDDQVHIAGRGCMFTRDANELSWDKFSAAQAVHAIGRASFVVGVMTLAKKDLPVTYLFKTARGEVGLMQVLDLVEQKHEDWSERGMKFHYKLVQGTGTPLPQVAPAKSALVYGPVNQGLQAALEVTPGEPCKLRIYVRNASDRGILIEGPNYRQDDECLLTDATGRAVPVTMVEREIVTPMKSGYFLKGQVSVSESGGLSFRGPGKLPASASYVAEAAPGRYIVRMRMRLPGNDLSTPASEHAWKGELETGPVTIEVKEPEAQPAAPVADFPMSAVLGPVVERVLGDFQTSPEKSVLSFETGLLRSAPSELTFATLTDPSLQPVAVAWARGSEVDAVAFVTMKGDKVVKCGLLCPGVVVLPITNPKFVWDSVSPGELKAAFEKRMHEWSMLPAIAELASDGEFPASFMILDTRTRRRGVLQITGAGDQPRSVKIRYRLVEGAPVKKTAPVREPIAPPRQLAGSPAVERLFVSKEQFARIDALLQKAPVTTQMLAAIFERDESPGSSYRRRADVVAIPILPAEKGTPDVVPVGEVLATAGGGTFYIQWDAMGASTHHYYGPFVFNSEVAAALGPLTKPR